MGRVRLVVAPGIWRHPEWILDEFERLMTRYRMPFEAAVADLCSRQDWGHKITRPADRQAVVHVWPNVPAEKTHEALTTWSP